LLKFCGSNDYAGKFFFPYAEILRKLSKMTIRIYSYDNSGTRIYTGAIDSKRRKEKLRSDILLLLTNALMRLFKTFVVYPNIKTRWHGVCVHTHGSQTAGGND